MHPRYQCGWFLYLFVAQPGIHDADHDRIRSTRIWITGPGGGSLVYTLYFPASSARPFRKLGPDLTTSAVPSSLTHHNRVQSFS